MTGATFSQRAMPHLIAMCDGRSSAFFDHELAARMHRAGTIERVTGGYWIITRVGKDAVIRGFIEEADTK